MSSGFNYNMLVTGGVGCLCKRHPDTCCMTMPLCFSYNMATGGVEDRSLFKKFQFHYAVFDEGHLLKNMSSLRFQNLMKISVSLVSLLQS